MRPPRGFEEPGEALTDEALLAGIVLRRFEALAELYKRRSAAVYELAVRLYGADAARVVLRDVFLELWHEPDGFDADATSLAEHLATITESQVISHHPFVARSGGDAKSSPRRRSGPTDTEIGDRLAGMHARSPEDVGVDEFGATVLSQMSEGALAADGDGRLTFMNVAASSMLGWTEDELRGKRVHDAIHFQTADGELIAADDCVLFTAPSYDRLLVHVGEVFTRKDGSTFPVTVTSTPVHAGPMAGGIVAVFRDATEPVALSPPIRVLIAEARGATSDAFQRMLSRKVGIEIVFVGTTSEVVISASNELRPDVVVLAHDLPGGTTRATVSAIRSSSPDATVLLLINDGDDEVTIDAVALGCSAVVRREGPISDLLELVRAAHRGEHLISRRDMDRVLEKVREGPRAGRAAALTPREVEVLASLRQGLSNAQVARRIGVSTNTVRNHVQRILSKLNVHSKLEAIALPDRDGPR